MTEYDPEVFTEGIFDGEIESVSTNGHVRINIPQQLSKYLVYAIKHFQTSQDRSIIIEWIQLTKDILDITLRVVQEGCHSKIQTRTLQYHLAD